MRDRVDSWDVYTSKKQVGAELGQAQVKLDDIVEVVVKVIFKALIENEVQLLFRVGGQIKQINTNLNSS